VVCSSIATLMPAFGEVGYAAANMFIDAYAHYKNLTGKTFFTAVNWDTWQEVGAAVESVKRQKQAGKTSYIRLEDGIRPAEGWEVFTMVLENPIPRSWYPPKTWTGGWPSAGWTGPGKNPNREKSWKPPLPPPKKVYDRGPP